MCWLNEIRLRFIAQSPGFMCLKFHNESSVEVRGVGVEMPRQDQSSRGQAVTQ